MSVSPLGEEFTHSDMCRSEVYILGVLTAPRMYKFKLPARHRKLPSLQPVPLGPQPPPLPSALRDCGRQMSSWRNRQDLSVRTDTPHQEGGFAGCRASRLPLQSTCSGDTSLQDTCVLSVLHKRALISVAWEKVHS